ncbi:hypothetical protein A9F13_16g00572 [Clavispora lusitaniae]|uniref:Uncharacterized protein n=1 Tax=Clavispora lusitaniae TaxID=36911 RepID=A0AA91T0F7_CLALS|nr:hypothetical protein A9F13_16g00572 [Clavispora lusitaniae]
MAARQRTEEQKDKDRRETEDKRREDKGEKTKERRQNEVGYGPPAVGDVFILAFRLIITYRADHS